ncbi:MAG: hypothetical protein LBH57_04145 [Treponema sp.]|nr:hypothetical protein [Treponema sp.]
MELWEPFNGITDKRLGPDAEHRPPDIVMIRLVDGLAAYEWAETARVCVDEKNLRQLLENREKRYTQY